MPSTQTRTDGKRQLFQTTLVMFLQNRHVSFPHWVAKTITREWYDWGSSDRERVQRELDDVSKYGGPVLTVDSLELLETAIDYLADQT